MATSDIITTYGLVVGSSDYSTIEAFCEDYKIKGLVSRKNMQIELAAAYGYLQPIKDTNEITYIMDEVEIIEVEGMSGGKLLALTGNSPTIEELSKDIIESLEGDIITDEPVICIPFAVGEDYNVEELNELSLKLRHYLTDDRLTFFEKKTRYLSEDEYSAAMDGKELD